MKRNKVFLRNPPEGLSFKELFRFIWLQGIGNKLDEQGEPQPWNDAALEDRFYELGYEIDKRSIQNWLAGNNKPSSKNLHKLARIVSNDDPGFKRLWRDAFTLANVSNSKSELELSNPDTKPVPIPAEAPKRAKINTVPFLLGGTLFLSLLTLVSVLITSQQAPLIEVTNLKFCDEARFDRTAKVCTTNVSHFPAGTTLVFVSFNMPNAPEGQPFERRWYREGQMFLSKDGFMDAAWEDYTWIENPNGHDHGKYDLRIIVNGRVTTGSFLLGEVNEDHEWP